MCLHVEEVEILQFADDTQLFISGNKSQLPQMIEKSADLVDPKDPVVCLIHTSSLTSVPGHQLIRKLRSQGVVRVEILRSEDGKPQTLQYGGNTPGTRSCAFNR